MSDEFEVHEAFQGAGEEIGMEIWRIEQFEPVKQDPKNDGKFYNHDAYICLSTTQIPGKSKFEYSLHFWLGKFCAQDEAGTAAMRTVELDSGVLNGAAIQYREVQGHETKLFCSYFKGGIQYLEGGVESGFKKVDHDAYTKRLFQCKGKKNVRVEQVECNCGSLNQGDTFVLDDGKDIYVWIGPYSEKKEQMVGVEAARRLRDEEKAGRALIHIVEDWDTNEEFYHALGSKYTIKAAGDDDEELVRRLDQELMLYEIVEAEEPTEEKWCNVYEVGARPLLQSMLNSDYCYVLDSGYSGMYLWTGKNTSNEFKKQLWGAVNKFLSTRGYPDWVSVTRVVDGGETPLFKQYFESWENPSQENGVDEEEESNVAGQDYSGAKSIDMEDLHTKDSKAEEWMPDDANGTYTMWRINEKLDLVEVPEKAHGAFFGEDCYVIQYQYEKNGSEQYILYFWQGINSHNDQRAASAGHTVKLDDALGGQAVQMRVVMNKEPAHFLKIFKGRTVFFEGGSSKGYRGAHDYANFNPNIPYMFDVRSRADGSVRAVQVECRAASLNSNSIFLIDAPGKPTVWVGKYSGEAEIELAKEMVEYTAGSRGDPAIVMEGEETAKFWDIIGGEEPYYTGPKETKNGGVRISPRLFQCSMTSGRFTVDEIVHFEQQDLDESDVMLLDTYDEIFIWIGSKSREWEKQEAMKTAYLYLESDPTGRTKDNTLIICVRQGFEPPQFSGCFHPWDSKMWSEGKTFHELMEEVGSENAGINLLEDEAKKYTSTYPLDILQQHDVPEGVDPTKKEMYLSDEDFNEVFDMSKDDFLTYPKWKRDNMRKEHGLF